MMEAYESDAREPMLVCGKDISTLSRKELIDAMYKMHVYYEGRISQIKADQVFMNNLPGPPELKGFWENFWESVFGSEAGYRQGMKILKKRRGNNV